jgi:hypothetical protein
MAWLVQVIHVFFCADNGQKEAARSKSFVREALTTIRANAAIRL